MSDPLWTDLRAAYNEGDVQIVDITVPQARSIEIIGEDTEELYNAIDLAQAQVFGGTTSQAFVLIRITQGKE
jgi:hypothetical protein